MRERKVITSVVLSLAFHAGGLGTLAIVGTHEGADRGSVSQLGLPAGFELALNTPLVPPPLPEAPPPPPPPPPEPIKPPETKAPDLMPDPEEPAVPLGIDEGAEASKVWKGAKEATENLAPKSEVDQAAYSMDPRPGSKSENAELSPTADAASSQPRPTSAPSPPAAPTQQTPPSKAESVDAPKPEAARVQPEPVQDKPAQELPKQDKAQQLEPQQLEKQQPKAQQLEPKVEGDPETKPANTDMQVPRPRLKPVQPDTVQPLATQEKPVQDLPRQADEQQLKPVQTEPQKDGAAEGSTKDAPPESQSPPSPSSTSPESASRASSASQATKATLREADPGKKADEESAAAAVVGSLVYKPGEPLAGKGLKVSTVRPKFGYTTMAVARPRDVIMNVTFGRDGRVLKAAFKDGKGTGYEDVDKPLVEAVYRWTAKGEALTKIPAGKPHAGVTFEIKFLWGLDPE